MAKLRMAHASTHGARKPPGPIQIYYMNLEHINPQVLAQSLNNLEVVELYQVQLNNQQVNEMFTVMNKETRIKRLVLQIVESDVWCYMSIDDVGDPWSSLSSLDCQVFAKSVNKLQELSIPGNVNHMHAQWNAMFQQCMVETNLKTLVIPNTDLSMVEPTVLAKCVNKMKKVDICHTKLTKKQVVEVFRIMEKETKLKKLKILGNDLSTVEPDTLVHCVDKLESVKISVTNLTKEQVDYLLQHCPVKTNKMLWTGKDDKWF